MKIAIISDIHANWPALQAVLAKIDQTGVERIFCAGDIIGYYTEPVACLEEMIERRIPCIRGNHERMVLGEIEGEINPQAMQVIEYTRGELSTEHTAFIERLKNILKVPGYFVMVHGSPRNRDEYLQRDEQFLASFEKMDSMFSEFDICFFGHTHIPMIVSREDGIVTDIHEDWACELRPDQTYLINPGSVGQPRDGCPKASFLTYDSKSRQIQFYRLNYDIELAQSRVREVGFPDRLAERLQGAW